MSRGAPVRVRHQIVTMIFGVGIARLVSNIALVTRSVSHATMIWIALFVDVATGVVIANANTDTIVTMILTALNVAGVILTASIMNVANAAIMHGAMFAMIVTRTVIVNVSPAVIIMFGV